MLFCIKNPSIEVGNISLNGEIINKGNYFTYLCVIIDSHYLGCIMHNLFKNNFQMELVYCTKKIISNLMPC